MRASPECYSCLEKLIQRTVVLATSNDTLRRVAVEEAMRVLRENFSVEQVSIVIASKLHRVIQKVTGNPDPYREVKKVELAMASQLYPIIKGSYSNSLVDCVKIAALGNSIDFFRNLEDVKQDMMRPVVFAVDETCELMRALDRARNILFLADNAGELLFDLPLLVYFKHRANVVYVVKPSPVQDDTTVEEVREAGLEGTITNIMTTGTATPGVDFDAASSEFLKAFENADLVFAKGMGYYESLTETPACGRVFLCLMAKCKPVADSLGVPQYSYVVKKW